jgi:pimeloyl-ACP methyl ester carboxylesterase
MCEASITVRSILLWVAIPLWLTSGCLDPGEPGNLVPPTADEDPLLPQLDVDVAGRARTLHLEELGDRAAPALFVLHGSFTDYRGLRPLAVELSSRYHVVIWDQRGAGLSERIDEGEFSLDSAIEEIEAVRAALVPGQPVTLIGHSWGGGLATAHASRHPTAVHQLVLVEPMPLTAALMNEQAAEIIQFSFFNAGWNDQVRMGLEAFTREVLIVGGECGALGAEFQHRHLELFPAARVEEIADVGHRMFVERPQAVYDAIEGYLEQFEGMR